MIKSGLVKKYTEPEYRKLPNLSYSGLAGVDKNPANLLNNGFKMTKSMIYGSVVDCLLFDGQEDFKEKYAILEYDGPTDTVKDIVDAVYSSYIETKGSFLFSKDATLKSLSDTVLRLARQMEYGAKNWKDETIVNKIINEGGNEYFNFLQENIDKVVVDPWMYERAINSIETLTNHEFSKKYLVPEHEDIEIHFQYPIDWVYDGVPCKSLLDILYIDHREKQIIPVDLKTTYDNVLMFPPNYVKWKYYIQAAFYSKAVSYLKLEYPNIFNYSVEQFRFMVISSTDTKRPLVWMTSKNDIVAGELGGVIQSDNQYVKGFKQLIEEYKWHIKTEQYDFPKEAYELNGHLKLNVF